MGRRGMREEREVKATFSYIIGNLQKHFHLNVYKKSQGIKKCQTKNVKKARRLKNFRAREKYKAREKF